MIGRARLASFAGMFVLASVIVPAHDGPPFPIVSDRAAGPYLVSVWTDPDTTDDGSAGGQFWVRLHVAAGRSAPPPQTRATVTIRPLDRTGRGQTIAASPVRNDITNQFAALVMDHEGRFAVHVAIEGPLGRGEVDGAVDATYDLRPAPGLIALYLVPFVLAGLLWLRLLVRRRAHRQGPQSRIADRRL